MSFRVVRDSDGNVIAFGPDDGSFEPSQSYSVEEEAPQVPVKNNIRAQIDTLERQQLMPRATREFMLAFMELNVPAEVLAVNPGYQAVKAFDNQIKALRDQL